MTAGPPLPARLGPLDDLMARHFPLLPRTRPSCRPLPSRVAHVEHLVQQAAGQPPADALLRAAEAHNFAALIASDCGMPDLARTLCLRQYATIRANAPVSIVAAKLALQPLVNLGRLHTRDGDGDAAHRVFQTLFTTVRDRRHADLDALHFDARALVVDADHAELTQWLWAVVLADGSRALARAGRWREARDVAAAHHGIGERLLDGRQVAVIDAYTRGDPDAQAMLEASTTPTAWERAVASCLTAAWHLRTGHLTTDNVAAATDSYRQAVASDVDATFAVRLGLAIASLAADHPAPAAVIAHLEHTAISTGDAYIARDVLGAAHAASLTLGATHHLTTVVEHAGLDVGGMPEPLLTQLTNATDAAEHAIAAAVAVGDRPPRSSHN
ncbi:hypothetical protein Dvina_51910 [Dactylosporangium vinaceum]|uniref:XRE family transcriptional regulator n=1 Tax=Dactylosporangium vinaceum TaxID=53362 RepID=A0ABV5M2R8_9ACTN|nr:hypothetical protein [Dactylosporangium vinaceum]UAB96344.1 hypothetical protein Dvina_51910 [Dactylosporangium vinaceum]